jgi:hypothetical protein
LAASDSKCLGDAGADRKEQKQRRASDEHSAHA